MRALACTVMAGGGARGGPGKAAVARRARAGSYRARRAVVREMARREARREGLTWLDDLMWSGRMTPDLAAVVAALVRLERRGASRRGGWVRMDRVRRCCGVMIRGCGSSGRYIWPRLVVEMARCGVTVEVRVRRVRGPGGAMVVAFRRSWVRLVSATGADGRVVWERNVLSEEGKRAMGNLAIGIGENA